MLQIKPFKTPLFRLNEDLCQYVIKNIGTQIQENQIVAVTSKIVSLAEGRVVPRNEISKEELVQREADLYLCKTDYDCHLTIKHGLFIPSAGIDESNSESDEFIVYPIDPFESARSLCKSLREQLGIKKLGLLLTDSTTRPLRQGVTGVALSYFGFRGLENIRGEEDLFGRELKMTQINVADALATAAVLTMGEGNNRTPLALIQSDGVHFEDSLHNNEIKISLDEDLYGSFFRAQDFTQ